MTAVGRFLPILEREGLPDRLLGEEGEMGKGFAKPQPRENSGSSSHSSPVTTIGELTTNLINHFEDIPDPRATRTRKHLLKDILVIAVLAAVAGAEGWEDIENYGISKQQWLEEFLELPNGIPSDDTFRARV